MILWLSVLERDIRLDFGAFLVSGVEEETCIALVELFGEGHCT